MSERSRPTSRGRPAGTISSSALLKRLTADLGLELVITPVGFKWIYAEMLAGDFLIGGEESGGIGIPSHVRERDGLYVSLLLTELMAKTGKSLAQLVADLQDAYGHFHFQRDDLRITPEAIAAFRAHLPHVHVDEVLGEKPVDVDRRDGLRLGFDDDSWILVTPAPVRNGAARPHLRRSGDARAPRRPSRLGAHARGERSMNEKPGHPRLRVLMVNKYGPEVNGGVEVHVDRLARSLVATGEVEVDSLAVSSDPAVAETTITEPISGYRIILVPQQRVISSTPFGRGFDRTLAELSREADIVHAHFPYPAGDRAFFAAERIEPSLKDKPLIIKTRFLIQSFPLRLKLLKKTIFMLLS